MNNITLLSIELIISIITMLLIYKVYKIKGLYVYSIVAFILSNIMSLKTISVYNFDTNLGIILFTTVFISNNIIIQKKGLE